jgi:DNA-binding NtrC family response regulator
MLAQFPATFSTPAPDQVPPTSRELPWREGKRALHALVVDDEPLLRWAIAETLRDAGYAVDEAADADSTVHALFEHGRAPDVVLLDLRLPDCSDLRLLETVRQLAPAATVILMTAFGSDGVREQARSLGAAGFLDKPFDVDALAGLVASLRCRH